MNTETFTIREIADINSRREGYTIQARNLRAAKIAATKRQEFCGTVLVIEDEYGDRLASRTGGAWTNASGRPYIAS